MNEVFWWLLGYCCASRLLEVLYSAYNRGRLKSSGFISVEHFASFAPMAALHGAWIVCTFAEAFLVPTSLPIIQALALATFLIAQVGRFWVLRSLGSHWNVGVMAPSAPFRDAFVSTGPYRFVRHPNYLIVVLEIASLPLIGGAMWTAIAYSLANAAILVRRIQCEDLHLFSRPGYREAMASKPALMFIPFLHRAR